MTTDRAACIHGHPYPENAARNNRDHLYCRACARDNFRRYYREGRLSAYEPVPVDPIAIERAAAGDPPERLTPRERHAAIRQLDRWQLPTPLIADRIGCHERTVWRARAAARQRSITMRNEATT